MPPALTKLDLCHRLLCKFTWNFLSIGFSLLLLISEQNRSFRLAKKVPIAKKKPNRQKPEKMLSAMNF